LALRRDQMKLVWTARGPFFATCLWLLTTVSAAAEAAGSEGESPPAYGKWTVATEDATWKDTARDREVPVRIYAPDRKHGNGPFR
jgi:hypothetical protein